MNAGAPPARFMVRRLAAGEDSRAWRDALAAFDPRAATLVKHDAGADVWRARLLGREVAVKRWELRGTAPLKALLHAWRGDRHWRGAHRLGQLGVPTARPWLLAMEGRAAQWLVMEWLDGGTVLDHLARPGLPARDEHAVAAALGEMVHRITSRGWCNRDSKPSNLVVTRNGGAPVIAVIDAVAIRRCLSRREGVLRMLASLTIEPLGAGCPPRRTLMLRCLRAWVLSAGIAEPGCAGPVAGSMWASVRARVEGHGDPRPRVDPLGGRQRRPAAPA